MVCKEDVVSWFKDLEGYKRIDVLNELLHMCLPFEIRFIGSCVEDMGKHSYQELHGHTVTANDMEKLSRDASLGMGLLEEQARHRTLIYLSVLRSRSYSVATWMYKNVLRTEWLEDMIAKGNLTDENVQSELLLLFVMALYHPAFSFEHKFYFLKILELLTEFRERGNGVSPRPASLFAYPPGFGYPSPKHMEPPVVPVKSMSCMDGQPLQHPGVSPGLHPVHPPPPEFVAWSRPGFPCGAPEVPPPFSTTPIVSPLVNNESVVPSPNQSRGSSPHRTSGAAACLSALNRLNTSVGPHPPPPLQQQPHPLPPPILDPMPPLDVLQPLNNFQFIYNSENIKGADEELTSIPEEKPTCNNKSPWLPPLISSATSSPPPPAHPPPPKSLNGLRVFAPPPPASSKLPPPFGLDHHFQALTLAEVEASVGVGRPHPAPMAPPAAAAAATSSSNSSGSPNQTPPETPAANQQQHQHNRGAPPNRAPPYVTTSPPPPPPPTYHSNSVPYTYAAAPPPPAYSALPPPGGRGGSMFSYAATPPYRPPFTAHLPTFQQANGSTFAYSYPYVSVVYSGPQFAPRTGPACCYNCGAQGHVGGECAGQTIEDITQKKTFQLEYEPAPLTDDK